MPLFVPKDRKSLFRQYLAGMYDAVVITDPNGHILEVNPRAEEHFGRTLDELTDKPVSSVIARLETEVVQRIRRGLSEDQHMLIDGVGLRRDGSRFPAEITVSSIEMTSPDDLIFTIRNVERRRKMREKMCAKESAFNLTDIALFACDREGRFTEMNPAFLEMFGFASEDEAREHRFSEILCDEPLPRNFERALAGEKTTVGIVAESDGDSDTTETEVTLGPSRFVNKIVGVAGCIRQI